MTNAKIAAAFAQVADLLEFTGANPFRVRAYRSAARTIHDLPESVASILQDPARDLTQIEGIGNDLAAKCASLVETGKLPLLEELLQQIPRSVLDLLRVPGLGPKKAAAVFQELQVTTLEQLREACEAQRVRQLKGFGAKTEQAILAGLDVAAAANQRLLWAEADEIAQQLQTHLQSCPALDQVAVAGSYRRGRDTVGDLDLLITSQQPDAVMDCFGQFPDIETVLGRGDTKMSVRLSRGLQVDLRVVAPESFGAALQYFTGSKDHNVELRGRAKQMGLKVNEYGVYRLDDDRYIAGRTEEEVYAALGLPTFPPELREAREEFAWATAGPLPQLVDLADLRGDLHVHTNASDGTATMREMVQAARQRGLTYLAITDHSRRVSMARGLDPQRLRQQWKQIDQLRQELGTSFTLLKGVECDILEQGGMDLPDDVLAEADWVLGSIHYGQRQSRQQITERILGALENPYVTAIAHPTGRLLNRREAYEVDLEAVFQAAREHGKLLELNANPMRLDLNDVACAAAKRHGIPIVISTDAHSPDGLGALRYGVQQARRGGLTKEDVANAAPGPNCRNCWAAAEWTVTRSTGPRC